MPLAADVEAGVDTALVIAVDISDSVDAARYRLQMEGIAAALEDTAVTDAILSGPHGAVLVTLVPWADRAAAAIPWRRIASAAEARQFAADVRALGPARGEFTCVAHMLRHVAGTILPSAPLRAASVVVDVSGDGIDNCSGKEATAAERDDLTAAGVTINGLPILVPGENDVVGAGAYRAPGWGLRELPMGPASEATTLDAWYRDYLTGGPGSFIMPARGYGDFARAFRQKFLTEISAVAARRQPGIERIRHPAR